MLAVGSRSSAATLAEETDVLDLFAGLPKRFVVDSTEDEDQSRVFRLRSAEPIERGTAGPLYL